MATAETPASPAETTPDAVVAAPAPEAAAPAPSAPKAAKTAPAPSKFIELSVKDILTKAGDNIRTGELPEIEELSKSIDAEGLSQPIVVTPSETPGKYTVIAGHRRLAATRSLGRTTIPAMVVDADVNRRIKLALIENIQRKDMTALDKAKAFAKLIKGTGLEQQQVAEAIGVAPGYVSQYIALLELPESALTALRDEELSFTQARALCRLLPNVKAIDDLVFEASELTVAAMEAKIAHILGTTETEPEAEAEGDDADGEDKPKKKKAKAAPSEKAVEYYVEADFHPLKKDDIRELMVSYKRKEVNADTAKKREEYRLILKGITLAADLRLK
jgi:ParB family chromosome partitioning protein